MVTSLRFAFYSDSILLTNYVTGGLIGASRINYREWKIYY